MKKKLLRTISLLVFIGYSFLAQAQTTIPNVPYWYQYNNQNNPGGTCQITAMASVLEAYGATGITPDKIYNRHNYNDAKEPYGWANMFNSEAALYGLSVRANGTKYGSPASMRSNIDAYKPVVVFGYFTSGGHIITTLGYNNSEYICHDPAGVWNEVYKGGGYTGYNSTGGKYVSYSRSNYEYAVGTPAPEFWMTTFTEPLSEPDAYCNAGGENTVGEWIESVNIGSYNLESGNNDGYHRNLGFNIHVTQGETYNIQLEPGFSSSAYTEYWKIYADLNQDGDFNDYGELLYYNNSSSTLNGNLTIPSDALTGTTRIRFIMKGDSYTADACETFTYGEVEDYQLKIEEGNTNTETITLNHPGAENVGEAVTFYGDVSSGVSTVKIYTGQWLLGTADITNGSYSIAYSFNTAGNNRELEAIGLNSSGTEVASTTSTIDIVEGTVNNLTINHPAETALGQSTTFSGSATGDIAKVKLYVDTYYIGESNVSGGSYTINYSFSSVGSNRHVEAKGFNANGSYLTSTSSTIDVFENTSTYNLSLNHVSSANVGESVLFSGTATGGIENVVVSVDGYQIANENVYDGNYSFAYTFNGAGTNRTVTANAFINGESVKKTSSTITINEVSSGDDWGELFADDLLNNSYTYENQAWSDINNQGTPCAAFVAVGLRNHPTNNFPGIYPSVTEGPTSESCSVQLKCTLEQLGFDGPYWDLSYLKRGDIVFTDRTVPFEGQYWSSHAMVFDHWATESSTSYAWFIDYHNERGLPYQRNCSVSGTYDKALFYYRYNDSKNTTTTTGLTMENETLEAKVFPNPANKLLTVESEEASKIVMFNNAGQVVLQIDEPKTIHKIDVTGLKAGLYIVKAQSSSRTTTMKTAIIH